MRNAGTVQIQSSHLGHVDQFQFGGGFLGCGEFIPDFGYIRIGKVNWRIRLGRRVLRGVIAASSALPPRSRSTPAGGQSQFFQEAVGRRVPAGFSCAHELRVAGMLNLASIERPLARFGVFCGSWHAAHASMGAGASFSVSSARWPECGGSRLSQEKCCPGNRNPAAPACRRFVIRARSPENQRPTPARQAGDHPK